MRFFADFETVEYPDDAVALRQRVLADATRGPHAYGVPHRVPFLFISNYLDAGGGRLHPLLGDLIALADEINQHWDKENWGINLVAEMIKHRIEPQIATQAAADVSHVSIVDMTSSSDVIESFDDDKRVLDDDSDSDSLSKSNVLR